MHILIYFISSVASTLHFFKTNDAACAKGAEFYDLFNPRVICPKGKNHIAFLCFYLGVTQLLRMNSYFVQDLMKEAYLRWSRLKVLKKLAYRDTLDAEHIGRNRRPRQILFVFIRGKNLCVLRGLCEDMKRGHPKYN
jgi:hypothetical protein